MVYLLYSTVKFREDAKLDADMRSSRPVSRVHGGRHRLVPFVLEEGGRFGDHALLILAELAWRGAISGKLLPPASWKSAGVKDAGHFWLRRWKQEVSAWLHSTLSDTLLRQSSGSVGGIL